MPLPSAVRQKGKHSCAASDLLPEAFGSTTAGSAAASAVPPAPAAAADWLPIAATAAGSIYKRQTTLEQPDLKNTAYRFAHSCCLSILCLADELCTLQARVLTMCPEPQQDDDPAALPYRLHVALYIPVVLSICTRNLFWQVPLTSGQHVACSHLTWSQR